MAVYQKRFKYNNRSNIDFGLEVVTFSPDTGEKDSYLSMESVYTESFDGTMRHDYGAKYEDVVSLYITMVKNNYSDFSRIELRQALNWLTGLRKVSWLDLYYHDSDEIVFSFLGRVTDIKLQKMDSRIIGIKVEFTSVSPWAYSGIRKYEFTLDGSEQLYPIRNGSDEDSVYVYPKVVFVNKALNGTLRLLNTTTEEETVLQNLAMNEMVTMDSNKIIYSDNTAKIFGEDFNSQWLRFVQGYNHIKIIGTGHLVIEYRDIFKVADAFDENDDMNIIPVDNNMLLLTEVNLLASKWVKENVPTGDIPKYSQVLSMSNTTKTSKVDLQPNETQLLEMQNTELEMQVINEDGVIKAYSYGNVPTKDYKLQATIEETSLPIIRYHATVTLYANAWYGQGDIYTQPLYVKNITRRSIIDIDLTETQRAFLEDNDTTLFISNASGDMIAYAIGYKPELDYTVNIIITETTRDASKMIKIKTEPDIYAEPFYF
jgi:hypothetical protein